MKKIKINIPYGLNQKEELKEIVKKLNSKLLSGSGVNEQQLFIGDYNTIEQGAFTIEVKKTGKKPIEYITCPICEITFQSDFYFKVYTNYGGVHKRHLLCSTDCQNELIEMCGVGRAGKTTKELKPVNLFFKRPNS